VQVYRKLPALTVIHVEPLMKWTQDLGLQDLSIAVQVSSGLDQMADGCSLS
jgi:hypothetical protein